MEIANAFGLEIFNNQIDSPFISVFFASLKKSIMYSHPTCGYCDLMREELEEQGHDFEEIDVSKFPEYWKEIENLSGGDRITPVLVKSDGTVEIGFRGIGCNYNT